MLAEIKNMFSLSLTPFPTIEADEHGKRSITQWNISIPAAKKIKREEGVHTDIVGHSSLFKYAKKMNVIIPPELYNYSVKKDIKNNTLVSAASLDVLKIALWKMLSTTTDKRITVKRTWTIMFREPVEDETINFSLFEDGDY